MNAAADFKAAIPEPYQVLGLRLLPLSVGRYRLLKRFNVAFVADGDASAEMGDLILGVLICSMRCDEFLAFYESKEFTREVRRWASRIGANPPWYLRGKWGRVISCTWIGRHWRINHSFNFVEKMQLFQNYIKEAQEVPEYAPTHTSDKSSTAHWSTLVEITLRSELNWTVEEINEAPLTKALCDYFKHLEHQGLVKIFDTSDIEEGKRNAALLEEAAQKMGVQHGT